jgi:methenyltetrahydrofolate cyclohydrolase
MDVVKYSTMAVLDLLDSFASTDPVPGGGSASALAGAVATSLLLMVAGMTRTKTGAPEETSDLAEASSRLRPVRDRLAELIDADSDAYRAVVAALKLPKVTDDEKSARRAAIQAATKQATDVPLETMRLCGRALQDAAIVERCGNANAASDVSVAKELLAAGLRGARFNVEINLGSLIDARYVADVRAEVAGLIGPT